MNDLKFISDFEIIDLGILENDVYDLEVEENHNFFANDILVHNSVFFHFSNDGCIDELIDYGIILEKKFNDSMYEFTSRYTENEECINNHRFEIEFERFFSKLFLCDAKKKQAGYLVFKKGNRCEPELEVKGFESVKNDTPNFFKRVLNNLYEEILNNYNDYYKMLTYVESVKNELKKEPIENLIIYKKLSKDINEYTSIPQHIRALKNSGADIKKGENVNMLFVSDEREVIHYEPGDEINFKLDRKKYYRKFFVDKFENMDKSMHYKLFLSRNSLIDMSKGNLMKKKRKKMKLKGFK